MTRVASFQGGSSYVSGATLCDISWDVDSSGSSVGRGGELLASRPGPCSPPRASVGPSAGVISDKGPSFEVISGTGPSVEVVSGTGVSSSWG